MSKSLYPDNRPRRDLGVVAVEQHCLAGRVHREEPKIRCVGLRAISKKTPPPRTRQQGCGGSEGSGELVVRVVVSAEVRVAQHTVWAPAGSSRIAAILRASAVSQTGSCGTAAAENVDAGRTTTKLR